ncbi:MAG: hypothetical protein ABS76_07640 [Pelagibacterium sp. SCN 64-44]|nr:MAG: hypothetical protein ABS76_07640 [Pelagibacterium sp. SCN 64-44]
MSEIMIIGDINLKNLTDPAVPFARIGETLHAADAVLANLECCLFEPGNGHHGEDKAFHVKPEIGREALKASGVTAVGIANNVNFGTPAILSSVLNLDEIGVLHSGAGANIEAARAPVVVETDDSRIGFFQKSTLYWPTGHAASAKDPGIAVLAAHTAYQVPLYGNMLGDGTKPLNRPGVPPQIVTWADPRHLDDMRREIEELRKKSDFVVASIHWGLNKEVLEYMEQIGRAAVDAGADVVFGHGPHYALPVEVYKGKPIFYGLGCFAFNTGHNGKHGDWVGMVVKFSLKKGETENMRLQFVRNNAQGETVTCSAQEAEATIAGVTRSSAAYGTSFTPSGDELLIGGL